MVIKKNLSPEEKLKRAIRAKLRFRALVRRVIDNLYWLENEKEEDEDQFGATSNMFVNIQKLTRKRNKPQSLLTVKEKSILNKDKHDRTEKEKELLDLKVAGLRCFRRYPPVVKKQLAAVTYFQYFPPGRVIVRQNDAGLSMYFILEGEVQVTQNYFDKYLKEEVTVDLGTMEAGSGFGEVSLLHGINRTATITTLAHCEMLEIKKEDFDIVLKATVLAEWKEIKRCMSFFDYFHGWPEVQVRECCILGQKKIFHGDEIILGKGIGNMKFAYFIVSGSVDVIEDLRIMSFMRAGTKQYKLIKDSPEEGFRGAIEERRGILKKRSGPEKKKKKSGGKETVETRFIEVCVLTRLACFNLGENLKNRIILAREATECLLIPLYWLYQHNESNIWDRIVYSMDQRIPSTKEIFKDFVDTKKWDSYKKKLFDSIYSEVRRESNNSVHNIPYSIRLKAVANNEKTLGF